MKNIVYLSTSVKLLSDDDLLSILRIARKNNSERDVTGVLLYSEGTFIQVLEGNETDVDVIFNKIEADPRHKNIITLIDEEITEKSFPDWAMGFIAAKTDKIDGLLGYLRSLDGIKAKNEDNHAIATLKTFIESNNLTVRYR